MAGVSESVDGDVTGNHGNTDMWVVKLANTNSIQGNASNKDAELLVYPNPFCDFTNILISDKDRNKTELTFVVYDVLGKQIAKISDIKNNFKFEKGGLINGIYFYQLIENEKIINSGKLLVQ